MKPVTANNIILRITSSLNEKNLTHSDCHWRQWFFTRSIFMHGKHIAEIYSELFTFEFTFGFRQRQACSNL